MQAGYLLFLLGVCKTEILRSKDLQMEISSEFFIPRDLLKMGLVDANWVHVEKVFNRITPNAGLLEHRKTKEIIFETKEKSWTRNGLAEQFGSLATNYIQKYIDSRNWTGLFHEMYWDFNTSVRKDYLNALAEIIDVNAVDVFERTSIHMAAIEKEIDVMEILLKRNGANPNLRDWTEKSPLHYLGGENSYEMIELLLKYGAEIDAADKQLQTPLMKAVYWGNYNSVKTLLSHKANPNLKNRREETALDIAVRMTSGTDLVTLLLKYAD